MLSVGSLYFRMLLLLLWMLSMVSVTVERRSVALLQLLLLP
jgi:hypothetical protein